MWRKTDAPPRRCPVLGGLCLLLAAYFLLPISMGIMHIGMLWPTVLLALAASRCFFPRWLAQLPRWLRKVAAGALAVGLVVAAAILALMILAAARRPAPAQAPGTVIVLGCEVRHDDQPSLTLRSRIRAAYDYLSAHPEAVCVASGAIGTSGTITEAQCIRDTLVEMGISPDRIYLEEQSRSTRENLLFSAAIIAENHLDSRVALATDYYHQYRGQFFARQAGLTPFSSGCVSYWALEPGYWAREIVGVLAAWIRGY